MSARPASPYRAIAIRVVVLSLLLIATGGLFIAAVAFIVTMPYLGGLCLLCGAGIGASAEHIDGWLCRRLYGGST